MTDTSRWPRDAVMALSLLLAGYIAPRVTAGDPFKLGERSLKLYAFSAGKAKGNAANEQQEEEQPDSQFIRDRS